MPRQNKRAAGNGSGAALESGYGMKSSVLVSVLWFLPGIWPIAGLCFVPGQRLVSVLCFSPGTGHFPADVPFPDLCLHPAYDRCRVYVLFPFCGSYPVYVSSLMTRLMLCGPVHGSYGRHGRSGYLPYFRFSACSTTGGTSSETGPWKRAISLTMLELKYEYWGLEVINSVSTSSPSLRFIDAICSSYS